MSEQIPAQSERRSDAEIVRAHAAGEHAAWRAKGCVPCERGLLSDGYPGGFPSDYLVEALYAQQRKAGETP